MTTTPTTTADPDENAPTDKDAKQVETTGYVPDGNAGTVKYLGYYDIHDDQKGTEQCLVFESEQYGGKIEYISTPSGDAFREKLATLIASDDSPDITVGDALQYPGNVGKNLFEPLDNYIDSSSPLWIGMKDVIDIYEYQGNRYYYPHRITTSFALNYSKKTIADNDLEDPYTLYKNGEWTWEKWRELMIKFCDADEGNMGFYATDTILTGLIATTGTPMIEVLPDGTINNNTLSPDVSRAMAFYEKLNRDGVMNGRELNDWVSPELFAQNCDKLLFLGMEPEWTYTAATKQVQNPQGVENDILNTVSDFAFVPFPRDTQADKYYSAYNTYGFVVPKGAKNIKGTVDMINCFRVYDTDENVIAQVRADHVSPEPVYFTSGKYEGMQKWEIVWGEQEYDLWREMCDPEKFTFVNEGGFGFGQEFWNNYSILNNVAFEGESWTQLSAEINPVVESVLDDYRK